MENTPIPEEVAATMAVNWNKVRSVGPISASGDDLLVAHDDPRQLQRKVEDWLKDNKPTRVISITHDAIFVHAQNSTHFHATIYYIPS